MQHDESGEDKQSSWKNQLGTLLLYLPMVAIIALVVLYWSLN